MYYINQFASSSVELFATNSISALTHGRERKNVNPLASQQIKQKRVTVDCEVTIVKIPINPSITL